MSELPAAKVSRDWTETLPSLGPPPSDDAGHDTYRRYEYQLQVLFTWCMHLLANRDNEVGLRLLGLAPETYDDFVAVWRDQDAGADFFELVQIKSTDPAAMNPSEIADKQGMRHLYERWRELEGSGEDVRMSLACRADLGGLVREMADIATVDPAKGRTDLSRVMKNLGASPSDGFWQVLTLYKPFPSPKQIDRYNLGILAQLRLKQGHSLDGLDVQYRNLINRLRDGFLGREADERILEKHSTPQEGWAGTVRSRAIDASEILDILANNVPPGKWSDWVNVSLPAARKRALEWVQLFVSTKLATAERAGTEIASSDLVMTQEETEQLFRYRPYLPSSVRSGFDFTLANGASAADADVGAALTRWKSLEEVISRSLPSVEAEVRDKQPQNLSISYNYAALEISEEIRRKISNILKILDRPLSSRDLSKGARELFVALLESIDVDSEGRPFRKVPPPKIWEIYSLSRAKFARYVEELEAVGLADWDTEPDDGFPPTYEFRAKDFNYVHSTWSNGKRVKVGDPFSWDEFKYYIPDWKSLVITGTAVPAVPTGEPFW